MLKFGFELEFFCLRGDKPVLVPKSLPYDECGWLVEVRSEAHSSIKKAIFLLRAEVETVELLAEKEGVTLSKVPLLEIPRDLKVRAARTHTKGLIRYLNVYGHETHRNGTNLATASLHVSVTDERTFKYRRAVSKDGVKDDTFAYTGFIDHAKLIVAMDREFKDEIRAARRNPGFYEVKEDGRIEYRSLPNTVDLSKVEKVLLEVFS